MSSRVSGKPITIPKGVDVTIDNNGIVTIKGPKGEMKQQLHSAVKAHLNEDQLSVTADPAKLDKPDAMGGTMRSLLQNHVIGVTEGFTKKLLLVGVGYRVQVGMSGKQAKADLTLGFSHPVVYVAREGISFNAKTVTELEVSGIDKQAVGQVAAEIRHFRPPEPYKGKGIRYADERVSLKETKK